MKRTFMAVTMGSVMPLLCASAHAEDPAIIVGEVRVTAKRNGGPLFANSVLTSVDILGSDKIEDQNVMNSWNWSDSFPASS